MIQKKSDSDNNRKRVSVKNKKSVLPKTKRKKTAVPKKMAAATSFLVKEQSQRPKRVFVDSEELPARNNKTSLTLIARDPYWIHAYWEIAPSSIDAIREKIGSKLEQSAYVLRMYDVTLKDFNGDNANQWFDIEISPNDKSWYVSLWKDCVTYCGDIGIRTPDQEFFAFARSNFVTTPRESYSARNDMIWMDVPSGGQGEEWASPYVFIEQPVRRSKKFSQPRKGSKRKIYLTADDIRAYYYNLFPLLRLLKAKYSGDRLALKGLTGKDLEQSSFYGLKEGQFYKKIKLGASEELILMGGASEQLGGASERVGKERNFG